MAKIYSSARLQIVQMNTNDIVTTSITTHGQLGKGTQLAPERRKSIWD